MRNDFFRRSPKSPQDIAALPVVIWARLFLDLAPYLAFRKADGTELMTFYHRQVAEVVQEDTAPGALNTAGTWPWQATFAGQKLWFDDDREVPNARKTSELAYQQACAGLSDDLVATLTHFDFLRAKLEATNPQALIEDFGLYLVPEANVVGAARGESEPDSQNAHVIFVCPGPKQGPFRRTVVRTIGRVQPAGDSPVTVERQALDGSSMVAAHRSVPPAPGRGLDANAWGTAMPWWMTSRPMDGEPSRTPVRMD